MRKHLPETATDFLRRLREEPNFAVIQIGHLLAGAYGEHHQSEIEDWLSRSDKSARVFVFTAVAQKYGLHAEEAREAYLSLPPQAQSELDASINEELWKARSEFGIGGAPSKPVARRFPTELAPRLPPEIAAEILNRATCQLNGSEKGRAALHALASIADSLVSLDQRNQEALLILLKGIFTHPGTGREIIKEAAARESRALP